RSKRDWSSDVCSSDLVYTYHVGRLEAFEVVIQRRITTRGRFQAIEEVEHHFSHRDLVGQRHLVTVVNHVGLYATFFYAQRNNVRSEERRVGQERTRTG